MSSLLSLTSLSASAAFITYNNGITNVEDSSGPSWVGPTAMFNDIIADYDGSLSGPSGGSGATQEGMDLFSPGGGGLDITLLSWRFTTLELYFGAGSVTQSPGAATPGFEDYRYDDAGFTAPTNLTFYYDDVEWASGYLTRFVVEVDNNADPAAIGAGEAVLTSNTLAGQDFMDEISDLTAGANILTFVADSFTPISPTDPGTFGSAGSITIVPEPGVTAAGIGAMILSAVLIRRRKRA
ncbi:hypothetical protein [Cerasicoccus frondis]|uniref:hypothetical protein n=1 Tax=Cerasicoccus frondis TaxID=490090 RepID=UPI0028525C1D|nr:hypothetical protein [Cerasicoccus frondis]